MLAATVLLAIEVVAVVILLRVARTRGHTFLVGTCAFVVSLAAACSLSLALQAVILHSAGFFEEPAVWSILGWVLAGLIGFTLVTILKSRPRLIAAPCCLLGAASFAYSLLYQELLGLAIGVSMFAVALIIMYVLRSRSYELQHYKITPADYSVRQNGPSD